MLGASFKPPKVQSVGTNSPDESSSPRKLVLLEPLIQGFFPSGGEGARQGIPPGLRFPGLSCSHPRGDKSPAISHAGPTRSKTYHGKSRTMLSRDNTQTLLRLWPQGTGFRIWENGHQAGASIRLNWTGRVQTLVPMIGGLAILFIHAGPDWSQRKGR